MAGTVFGEGFQAFVTDWDKVTATVNNAAVFLAVCVTCWGLCWP